MSIDGAPVRSYAAWQARWLSAARRWSSVTIQVLGSVGRPRAPLPWVFMHIRRRSGDRDGPRLAIAAGIHGDEPAGVEAITRLLECPREWIDRFARFDVTIFPCVNPTGFERNTRTNDSGIDLNRTFDQIDAPLEITWMRSLLAPPGARARFDAAIELHEDVDGEGFYLYELSAGLPYAGDTIVNAVAPLVAIDPRPMIEGFPAGNGVIRLSPDDLSDRVPREWPQAVFSFRSGTPSCLTLETPSATLTLDDRAEIHLMALRAALAHYASWRAPR